MSEFESIADYFSNKGILKNIRHEIYINNTNSVEEHSIWIMIDWQHLEKISIVINRIRWMMLRKINELKNIHVA